jgi:hypothetical protein
MWDLKRSEIPEVTIARKLNMTRQTVHQALDNANLKVAKALDIATLKIGEALEEVARINKIGTQKINPDHGFLQGYSNHFKTQAFVTFSAKNGVQLWYKHEGDYQKCSKLQTCRETLLTEAKDRKFLISTIRAIFYHPSLQKP